MTADGDGLLVYNPAEGSHSTQAWFFPHESNVKVRYWQQQLLQAMVAGKERSFKSWRLSRSLPALTMLLVYVG